MEERYGEPLKAADLAGTAGLSPENKETCGSYADFLDHVETEFLKELLHRLERVFRPVWLLGSA